MKRLFLVTLLVLFIAPFEAFQAFQATAEEGNSKKQMIENPLRYIKITDWSFYAAARVAIIHHVTIENTADIPYKNIKVKVNYYPSSYLTFGKSISSTSGTLPITLPPRSKKTYLKGGITLGAGDMSYLYKDIIVLSATPVVDGGKSSETQKQRPRLSL